MAAGQGTTWKVRVPLSSTRFAARHTESQSARECKGNTQESFLQKWITNSAPLINYHRQAIRCANRHQCPDDYELGRPPSEAKELTNACQCIRRRQCEQSLQGSGRHYWVPVSHEQPDRSHGVVCPALSKGPARADPDG
jgi:hypothetical protein